MTVFMFPGQGSQSRGMGKALFAQFPELVASASDILGYAIEELCLEDPRRELNDTRFTQPALYVVNALSYRARLRDSATRPAFLLGHSLGEYNALEAAGAISFEAGLQLVRRRGELMAGAPPGAMAAVLGVTEAVVRQRLAEAALEAVDIANLNAPTQTIISGLKADIARAIALFDAGESRCIPLNTSGAFHSRQMAAARAEFEAALDRTDFAEPAVPVISNVHAQPHEAGRIAAALAEQLTRPVQWTRSVEHLLTLGEIEFVETGPGQVLTKLVAEIRQAFRPPVATPPPMPPRAPRHDQETERALLQQRIADWNRRHAIGTRVRVKDYAETLVTRTPAMVLFGHRAAIYLEGYNGYFPLSDVRPAD